MVRGRGEYNAAGQDRCECLTFFLFVSYKKIARSSPNRTCPVCQLQPAKGSFQAATEAQRMPKTLCLLRLVQCFISHLFMFLCVIVLLLWVMTCHRAPHSVSMTAEDDGSCIYKKKHVTFSAFCREISGFGRKIKRIMWAPSYFAWFYAQFCVHQIVFFSRAWM